MKIEDINKYLREGKTVKEIRSIVGMGEKKFQKLIKELGYEYNQKIKQYTEIGAAANSNTKSSEVCSTEEPNIRITKSSGLCNTDESNIRITKSSVVCNTEDRSILFIRDNIDLLEEMLMNYKHHKECSTNNYGITINLIDDKHKDNDKPKSIRVNYFVWEEWKEFTKDINYSSKELISMALKEYMEKYKK